MTKTTEDFDALDRQIEDLQVRIDRYRQAMTLSRAAIVVAALVLVLVMTAAGSYRTPVVVFSAIAVLIGATVWLGASKSSVDEAEDALAALEAAKNKLIDKVAAANGWRDMTPAAH